MVRTTLMFAAAIATVAVAQQAPNSAGVVPPASPQATPQDPQQPPAAAPRSPGEMEQLVAPVALYPDALLSQVLMASTYPLEIVQAHRFAQDSSAMQADALADALNQQPWDPSVKSLINFPTVLQLLDERLDWTIKLGDAFLAQQQDVMDTVQRLRAQAQAAGNLQDDPRQRITVQPAPQIQQPAPPPPVAYDDGNYPPPPVTQYITIENSAPDTYYVPVYDPGFIYGTWVYPRYRPFFWHPRDYVPTRGIWYGDPCRLGPAWGYAFGRPDWRDHRVDLDTRRNAAFNRRLENDAVVIRIQDRDRALAAEHKPVVWHHEPEHRLGVSYHDQATAQRYGGRTPQDDVQARQAYRGRDNVVPSGDRPSAPNTVARTPLGTPNTPIVPPNQRPETNNRPETNQKSDAQREADRRDAERAEAARQDANRGAGNRPDNSRGDNRTDNNRPETVKPAPQPDPKNDGRGNARPEAPRRDTTPNPSPKPDDAKRGDAKSSDSKSSDSKSADPKPQENRDSPGRAPAPAPKPAEPPQRDRGGAYNGAGNSGADAKSDSNRGAASRAPQRSAPAPAPAPAPQRSAPAPAPAPAPQRSAPTPAPAPAAPSGGSNSGGNSGGSNSGGGSGRGSGGSGRR